MSLIFVKTYEQIYMALLRIGKYKNGNWKIKTLKNVHRKF